MTSKRKPSKGAPSGASGGRRISYQSRHPPVVEIIMVPGYAEVTRFMLARFMALREKPPISRMDATEFQHAVQAVENWIALAEGMQAEAAQGGHALEMYRHYCDEARKIMHDVNSDAWIDSSRAAQSARASARRRPQDIANIIRKTGARPGTAKEQWPVLAAALENAGYTVRDASTRAGHPAIVIDGATLARPRELSLKTFENERKKKSR